MSSQSSTTKWSPRKVTVEQYTHQLGSYTIKPLLSFFGKLMRFAFGPLIKRKQAITYIDNTLLQAKD